MSNDYKIEGRPATIFRTIKNKDNPFVMVDRRPIDNPKLSWKAKGILTYLMSRPDGWEVNITDLMNHSTDGAASIRSGLKELRAAHHMCYHQARNLGRITGWLIEVYEIPYDLAPADSIVPTEGIEDEIVPSSPHDDFLHVENQQVENRRQVLKDLSNKELIIEEEGEEKNPKPRPNAYKVFEQEIGPLTPMISFEIDDFVKAHTEQWTIAAIRESALNGKRNVKYIGAILKRWAVEGYGSEIKKHQYKQYQPAKQTPGQPKSLDTYNAWVASMEASAA